MKLTLFFIMTLFCSYSLFASPSRPNQGSALPRVLLDEEKGGKVDGGSWDSHSLAGKVKVLYYIDPDHEHDNDHVNEALKKGKFPEEKFATVAIINMASTWIPNFLIQSRLKKRQKEFPSTLFVRDNKRVLVEKWGLQDDASNILLFNKRGELLFKAAGKLSDQELEQLINMIKYNLVYFRQS